MKGARFGKAQVAGDILNRQVAAQQVVLGQFLAQLIENLLVAGASQLQVTLQGAHRHVEFLRDPFFARQAIFEQQAQGVFHPLRQRLVVVQPGHQREGVFFQGSQQVGVGLAQRHAEVFQRHDQRIAALLKANWAAKNRFVLSHVHALRQGMFEPGFCG